MPMLWVVLFVACAMRAQAQETFGYCGRPDTTALRWQYNAAERTLTISGSGQMLDFSLEEKAPWYPWHNSIEQVVMGDSVTSVGSYALYNLLQLRHLHIPAKVSYIGPYAFRNLYALDSISVDAANTRYDSREDCNALIDRFSNMLLLGCAKTRMPQTISGIESCAFLKVSRLRQAVLPQSVVYIGTEAFNGCTSLDSLVLPAQLTAISAYAFQDCRSLDTLILPEYMDTIGIRAFANCSGLRFIRSNALTPPRIHATTFGSTSCRVDVPCPSVHAYRTAPVWSTFDSLKLRGWYELELLTRSNNYAFGRDTIYRYPDCDTAAIIYAEPYAGYEFVAWEDAHGHVFSTEARCEFYMDENMTLTAVFRKIEEALDEVMPDANTVLYDIMGRPVSAEAVTTGVYIRVVNGRPQKVLMK